MRVSSDMEGKMYLRSFSRNGTLFVKMVSIYSI